MDTTHELLPHQLHSINIADEMRSNAEPLEQTSSLGLTVPQSGADIMNLATRPRQIAPLSDADIMDLTTRPQQTSQLEQDRINHALAASLGEITRSGMATYGDNDLQMAKRLHDEDLFKTQHVMQDTVDDADDVLVLIKFPNSGARLSCGGTSFNTATIRLSHKLVLATGSDLLQGLLTNEQHQRRARKAASPLPAGVTRVLDLSPTMDEMDYIVALQNLSITKAVKLWHRSLVSGTSPLAVSGHDDVCSCRVPFNGLLNFDGGYPELKAPKEIQSERGIACIFDTENWPVEQADNVDDFCTTRWAANTVRLFRSIAAPPGQKDLLIDSAPRLWTLVGLFNKLEMTNYDILRDEVAAWYNTDANHRFVELCPEESLRIGIALKTPLISEPAFRILVNERALEVAGGQPNHEPTRTIFGRSCTSFTGTDADSISRMIEHASVKMAERYKVALDRLLHDDALDLLDIPEWQALRTFYDSIPKKTCDREVTDVLSACEKLMKNVRDMHFHAVNRVVTCCGYDLPSDRSPYPDFHQQEQPGDNHATTVQYLITTVEQMDEMRAYSVPKAELLAKPFIEIYDSLNQYQRALLPMIWQGLRTMRLDSFDERKRGLASGYIVDLLNAIDAIRNKSKLLESSLEEIDKVLAISGSQRSLLSSILRKQKAYVDALMNQGNGFIFTATPHFLLTLDDEEMNFLRLGNEEGIFYAEAPETDMGPSGPGPAFHTGHTVASVSDLDVEGFALSDDGASTVVGTMDAQDGFSTVYNRNRVLARSNNPSVASDQFTEDSAEYADAEYALPAEHQTRGQALAQVVEEDFEEYEEWQQNHSHERGHDYDDYEDLESGVGSDQEDVDEGEIVEEHDEKRTADKNSHDEQTRASSVSEVDQTVACDMMACQYGKAGEELGDESCQSPIDDSEHDSDDDFELVESDYDDDFNLV